MERPSRRQVEFDSLSLSHSKMIAEQKSNLFPEIYSLIEDLLTPLMIRTRANSTMRAGIRAKTPRSTTAARTSNSRERSARTR